MDSSLIEDLRKSIESFFEEKAFIYKKISNKVSNFFAVDIL